MVSCHRQGIRVPWVQPLAHPHITTDYSEALMEFITPPQDTIKKPGRLTDVYAIVHRHLENEEKLCRCRCPACWIAAMKVFPLAQYGSSNIGLFKPVSSWLGGALWSPYADHFRGWL